MKDAFHRVFSIYPRWHRGSCYRAFSWRLCGGFPLNMLQDAGYNAMPPPRELPICRDPATRYTPTQPPGWCPGRGCHRVTSGLATIRAELIISISTAQGNAAQAVRVARLFIRSSALQWTCCVELISLLTSASLHSRTSLAGHI